MVGWWTIVTVTSLLRDSVVQYSVEEREISKLKQQLNPRHRIIPTTYIIIMPTPYKFTDYATQLLLFNHHPIIILVQETWNLLSNPVHDIYTFHSNESSEIESPPLLDGHGRGHPFHIEHHMLRYFLPNRLILVSKIESTTQARSNDEII